MAQQPRVLLDQRKLIGVFDLVNPHAAGIDAGSKEHWASVPEDRDANPVRKFGVFTEDLYASADWLSCLRHEDRGHRGNRCVLDCRSWRCWRHEDSRSGSLTPAKSERETKRLTLPTASGSGSCIRSVCSRVRSDQLPTCCPFARFSAKELC